MTTVESPTRQRDAACPDWCGGHGGTWLPWQTETATGHNVRTHASPSMADFNPLATVQVTGEEYVGTGVRDCAVSVFLSEETFTASEARQLAAALLEAASVLEDAQAVAR